MGIMETVQTENTMIEDYKIDTSLIQNKIRKAREYRENMLTKTMEAQERVDRLTILMYQRFIMETEDWDN